MRRRKRGSLRDRVSHAYFMYGRFCSHHPTMTMLVSLFTLLFLSYPVTRIRLPSSAPIDAVWENDTNSNPDWLSKHASAFTLVQFLVRGRVEPWDSNNLRSVQSVRGPIGRAFNLREQLMQFVYTKGEIRKRLSHICLHVNRPTMHSSLPSHGCLLLSPAQIWENDVNKFLNDEDIVTSIFDQPCSSLACPRDVIFGMNIKATGIERHYPLNQGRTIQYVMTLIIESHNFDASLLDSFKDSLSSDELNNKFNLTPLNSTISTKNRVAHVFFYSQKTWYELIPLGMSYCVFLAYLYYSVSKIEMVKSKWGLAFSCVFTVASSLIMAAGICLQFDLTPTFWGAELFPYLAMIVGMENTLCITRSVVKIPVDYPVPLRIAHGLSKEGYSITKNFLTELFIIFVGFFTFLPEIQEFCLFACVGLVVDFYMQLFFYAPCLTFDMLRIGSVEKQQIVLDQLKSGTSSVQLDVFPSLRCPVMRFVPQLSRFFPPTEAPNLKAHLQRARSASDLNDQNENESSKQHKRTASSDIIMDVEHKNALDTVLHAQMPRRLKLLYFWARTRFFQRLLMALTVLWILWLAFIVHELQLMQQLTGHESTSQGVNHSESVNNAQTQGMVGQFQKLAHNIHSRLRPPNVDVSCEWSLWQKKSFRWWPYLFDQYNISLSGRHITLLPVIILDTVISPEDPFVHLLPPVPSKLRESIGGLIPDSLKYRISWLELQITIVLIMSCSIFIIVAAFLVYVCLAGRGSAPKPPEQYRQYSHAGNTGIGRAFGDIQPVAFIGHTQDIECVSYSCHSRRLVSSCLAGQVIIWDALSAMPHKTLQRVNESVNVASNSLGRNVDDSIRRRNVNGANDALRDNVGLSLRGAVSVWSMAVAKGLIVVGCADGSVELWDAHSVNMLSLFKNTRHGVTHLVLCGSNLLIGRLNGTVDFVELRIIQSADRQNQSPRLLCSLMTSLSVHQRPLTTMTSCGNSLAVTSAADHTLKLLNVTGANIVTTMYAHNAPVISVVADLQNQILYSSCSDGVLCCWNLPRGSLMKRLLGKETNSGPLALAISHKYLLALGCDGYLWIWNKDSHVLITRIRKQSEIENEKNSNNTSNITDFDDSLMTSSSGLPSLIAIGDDVAVTSHNGVLRFWNLKYKVLIKEVWCNEEGPKLNISNLVALNEESVACARGRNLYSISIPTISMG